MSYESASALIANENDEILYLSDIETYELLYLNQSAWPSMGICCEADYLHKPCYEVLQGLKSPCSFCTNRFLKQGEFYRWEHDNPILHSHFMLRDKLVKYNDRLVRLEIATDISKKEQDLQLVSTHLAINETLIKCISTLKGNNIDQSLNKLLEYVGDFYHADRAYIFEIDNASSTMNNTYEWCREAVSPMINALQCVPLNAISRWFEIFKRSGYIAIGSLSALDHDSLEYQVLQPQNVDSLIAAPLQIEENFPLGFIGIDNPRTHFNSARLLLSLANFITDDLHKRKLMTQLERLCYEDALTGLANRNLYIKRIEEFKEKPPGSLGAAFLDINGLKTVNDSQGHVKGDELIIRTARLLKNVFTDNIFRVGGDEFVVLCPDMDRETFLKTMEQLRSLAGQEETLSVSIGQEWTCEDRDAIAVVMRADKLMYEEKQSYYRNNLKGRIFPIT